MLASLVLRCLVRSGAEGHLRTTHSGFRRARGSTDAVFLLEWQIEAAWAARDGMLSALLLDWSKVCDRVDPAAMLFALERIGLPDQYVRMISAI